MAPIPEETSSGVQKTNKDLHNRKLFVVLLCIIQVPDKHSAGLRRTLVVCVAIAFLQRKVQKRADGDKTRYFHVLV